MNEEQKNIETCLPEDVLSEVANVPTDPKFRSLVNESLDPLKQQVLQQAGYDGYKEVVMYHQPYTFTSQVKQMKSNLILLLRRLWRFPFGRGTTASSDAGSSSAGSAAYAAAPIRSLADMWQHYITRLKGNPEYGIPSRLSSLTDLPAAPALLADRKIGGVPEAADGISLVQLISSSAAYNTITELTDTTTGWLMNKGFTWSLFPNLLKIALGCKKIIDWSAAPTTLMQLDMNEVEKLAVNGTNIYYNNPNLTEIVVPKLYEMDNGFTYDDPAEGCFISKCDNLRKVRIESLEKYGEVDGVSFSNGGHYCCLIHSCANLEEVEIPTYTGYKNWRIIRNCPKVWKVVLGNISYGVPSLYNSYAYPFDSLVNLYHLEIAGCTVSLNLSSWKPTTALSDNLQQFLSNFKTYIAERLTDKGSGLTLTLSQEVRNAIHSDEATYGIENIIITQKGWTISPAPN